MNSELKEALIAQANHEFFAAQSYEALALWCSDKGFEGFAGFFRKQAEEEREHAHRFLDHLSHRGELAGLGGIEAPRNEFQFLVEIAEHADGLEKLNTEKIHSCYELTMKYKEFASQPFLLEFIEEQVEEEAWTGTMVQLTRRCDCPGAQLNLDRHIEKILGEDS